MAFVNNTLTLIYEIINYTTKSYYNQYQYIMKELFIQKTYNTNLFTIEDLSQISDKFAFKAFYYLTYNCKFSSALVVSYIFWLFHYYILFDNVKSINWEIIQR